MKHGILALSPSCCSLGGRAACRRRASPRNPTSSSSSPTTWAMPTSACTAARTSRRRTSTRMAKRGVRFTNAYANGSFCTPTRAALMSGRYQQRFGNEDLGGVTGPLPRAVDDAAATAQGRGLRHRHGRQVAPRRRRKVSRRSSAASTSSSASSAAGTIHLPGPCRQGEYGAADPGNPRHHAGTEPRGTCTDALGEEAVRVRRAASRSEAVLPLSRLQCGPHAGAGHGKVPATLRPHRGPEAPHLRRHAQRDGRRRRRRCWRSWRETGKLDRTLVVFHNDNGGPTTRNAVNGSRNTPLRGSKCETFEGGIRVPLLMQWPGVIEAGSVYRQPVITHGHHAPRPSRWPGPTPRGLDGVDLVPFVTGKKPARRTTRCSGGAARGATTTAHVRATGSTSTPPRATRSPARSRRPRGTCSSTSPTTSASSTTWPPKHPDKLAELKKLYEAWSADVDADCRKLGIEPKMPKPALTPKP